MCETEIDPIVILRVIRMIVSLHVSAGLSKKMLKYRKSIISFHVPNIVIVIQQIQINTVRFPLVYYLIISIVFCKH